MVMTAILLKILMIKTMKKMKMKMNATTAMKMMTTKVTISVTKQVTRTFIIPIKSVAVASLVLTIILNHTVFISSIQTYLNKEVLYYGDGGGKGCDE